MWRRSENASSVKPLEVDETISEVFVYVRKDFEEVPTLDEEGHETGDTHWVYLEQAVPKEDWATYQKALEANEKADDNMANIMYIAMMADIDLDI
ncbi:MAG: hypothetical protein ILP16_09790 [Spirochaetales bacterium]|nr:hypothetical protein [Spirochaetales bacterium]